MLVKLPFVDDIVSDFSHLFVAIAIVFLVVAAWRSTSTADNRQLRAIYVFDRRSRRARAVPRLTNHTVAATLVESTRPSDGPDGGPADGAADAAEGRAEGSKEGTRGGAERESGVRDEREEIVETMDADSDTVRRRRLAFFSRNESDRDRVDGAGSSTEPFQTPEPSAPPPEEPDVSTAPSTDKDANSIRIKLKYLNDDLRSVDANLNETVAAFKRRHFAEELSQNKRVKLIFNGQLLQREEEYLRRYGLFDNCVVHCLIHQVRTSPEGASESSQRAGQRNERDWDLGNLLLTLVTLLLSLAWYTRYSYPQFFTITSTVALVLITGLAGVIFVGMFFPDRNVPNIEVHLR